jgi:hypothetical protein
MKDFENKISIKMKKSEAIVLFDLLSRNLDDKNSLTIELSHDSEDVVLNNILCILETELSSQFNKDYDDIVSGARLALKRENPVLPE